MGSEGWRPGPSLCGLGSAPSPSSSNEVTPEGTSGSFLLLWAHLAAVYCTGRCTLGSPSAVGLELLHPPAPTVGLCPPSPSFQPLGWQPRGSSGLVPAPGGVGGHCPTRMPLFLLGCCTLGCPVPLGHPHWFPCPGHREHRSHLGPPTNTLWAGTAKSPKDFFVTRISQGSTHCRGFGVTGDE